MQPQILGNQLVSIYPNPVVNKTLNIKFEQVEMGNYYVQLSDATGKLIQNNNIKVSGKGQITNIQLPSYILNGVYLLKILSKNKDIIYKDKIVVQ